MAVGDMTGLVTKLARMFFVRDFIVATGCFFFGTRAGILGRLCSVEFTLLLALSALCHRRSRLRRARSNGELVLPQPRQVQRVAVPGQYLVGAAFPMGKGTALAAELSAFALSLSLILAH